MNEIPIIKLTVESMRHQMLHHLSTQHLELERLVDDEVSRVIASGELERSIVAEMQRALPEHIRSVVRNALQRVWYSTESVEAISKILREATLKAIQRDV